MAADTIMVYASRKLYDFNKMDVGQLLAAFTSRENNIRKTIKILLQNPHDLVVFVSLLIFSYNTSKVRGYLNQKDDASNELVLLPYIVHSKLCIKLQNACVQLP